MKKQRKLPMNFRLDPTLLDELRYLATEENRALNNLVETVLMQYTKGQVITEEVYEVGMEKAYEEGQEKGYDEGREESFEEGHQKGYEEGKEESFEDGREQGYEEGQEEK